MSTTAMKIHVNMEEPEGCSQCLLTLVVNDTFDLEKAVCSYGFFMMAPNLWLPFSSTFQRPLRLLDGTSIMVRISQQKKPTSSSLLIRAMGVDTLTKEDQQYLLIQVIRMLRLSETEECVIKGFQAVHAEAREKGFGRLFRSPTLFEDMVKGILLCNCRWGRTLAMARSLCDFQSELKGQPLGWSTVQESISIMKNNSIVCADSSPKTPIGKYKKRKSYTKKPVNLDVNLVAGRLTKEELHFANGKQFSVSQASGTRLTEAINSSKNLEVGLCQEEENDQSLQISKAFFSEESLSPDSSCSDGNGLSSVLSTGDFPRPEELATVDERFLAKHCGLGYRAKRIVKLARDICEGAIDLNSFERSDGSPRLQFSDLKEILLKLDGFGPFTCAIVLMCMGDYETIPADCETVRHLKQIHGMSLCCNATVARDVQNVYGRYAPYQFLAYWCEMWDCYEKKFGTLSQMSPFDYCLISGNNMRKKIKTASSS